MAAPGYDVVGPPSVIIPVPSLNNSDDTNWPPHLPPPPSFFFPYKSDSKTTFLAPLISSSKYHLPQLFFRSCIALQPLPTNNVTHLQEQRKDPKWSCQDDSLLLPRTEPSNEDLSACWHVADKIQLQVFLLLMSEMALFMVLIVPLPFTVKRKLFT